MKKSELVRLKTLLQQETKRRNRINELLSNELIQEFIILNNLDIEDLNVEDKWLILEEILEDFQITESNKILVCTGSYMTGQYSYYQETEYYTKKVPIDNPGIEYQTFKDIETCKTHTAYNDEYIKNLVDYENQFYIRTKLTTKEYCHSRCGHYLVSELNEKYTILNPYSSSENENGFKEVQKDFFMTAIEKGQPKAKQLVLTKYSRMK